MQAAYSIGSVRRGTRTVKTSALIVSLLVGAYLMALAIGSPGHAWCSWFSLVPLFIVIRLCRPVCAMAGGALWGLLLYAFLIAQPDPACSLSISSLPLLAAIPAIYAFAGARLTRSIGFSPFVLGVAWMGVELAFQPLGLHNGLLGQAEGDTTLMHWIGGALGYVLVAFIVAYVNACLLSALSRVRVAVPRPRPAAGSDTNGARLAPQTFSCFPLFAIPQLQPRAPPDAR